MLTLKLCIAIERSFALLFPDKQLFSTVFGSRVTVTYPTVPDCRHAAQLFVSYLEGTVD